ncbi:hypothetical protein DL767_002202 [Monosporascus sp. MG133]|nr:hypothetical protein DL767_002202 [Monosporascus sp. MG133]
MPLFSVIRRGREQAKEQKAKDSAKAKEDVPKAPYKHVPTHAAIDAMSGAPNTFKDIDRAKILEQHRRRSANAANSASLKSYPRHGSSLSTVSYPSLQATPIVSRNCSFNSMPVYPLARSQLSTSAGDYPNYPRSSKGKERKAPPTLPTRAAVPTLAQRRAGAPTGIARLPMDNAEDSSGSDDELEMKKSTRQGISHKSHLAKAQLPMPRLNPTGSENSRYLYPVHQRKNSRQSQGETPYRHHPQTTRTRFTEPKPMDLGVLRDDLGRESSYTTLTSTHNGNSYASSSVSEIAPISTTPSSVASTPEPSVAVTYFPTETPKVQEAPSTEPTTGFIAVVSPPEASADALVTVPAEEPAKVAEASSAVVTTVSTALPAVDGLGQTCTLAEAKTSTASAKPPKKRRFSWRRNKPPTGDKLVASH